MYKKRLSMKRKRIVSIICMLIFSFISSNTYAEEKIGSIKVDTTMYKINDYNFSFALYYIGELENNRVLLRDELSDLNIDINLNTMTSAEISVVSKIVDKRIKELNLPYDKRNTGSDKMATFDNLNEGVYLITQSSKNGKKYDVDPFIVSVPYYFNGDEILNVVAKPKIEPTDPIKPTDPTDPENPNKPQDNDEDKPNKDENQTEEENNPNLPGENGNSDDYENDGGKTDLTIGKPKTGDKGLLRHIGIFLIALALFIYIRKR